MVNQTINSLLDLNNLRTAPEINANVSKDIFNELLLAMEGSEWLTIGIMATSTKIAIKSLRELESCFKLPTMEISERPVEEGPVFLKANQNTGKVIVRIEHGLGEGILISSQHSDPEYKSGTWGPLPLNFFDAFK